MVAINGLTFQRKDGSLVEASDAFADCSKIALYFSAHWCPPCRKFTPALKDFYEEVNDGQKQVEIVFVSADKSEEEMVDYHNEMGDWLRIPFSQEELRERIRDHYGKKTCSKTGDLIRSGIPCLVVIDRDHNVKTYDGVADIQALGSMALEMKW